MLSCWIDGSSLYLNEDLDYWTIRQWRKLCHLFKLQEENPFKYYKLEIISLSKTPFLMRVQNCFSSKVIKNPYTGEVMFAVVVNVLLVLILVQVIGLCVWIWKRNVINMFYLQL